MSWHGLARVICIPAFKLAFFTKYNKPPTELPGNGCIVCSNHLSAIDPLLLIDGFKRNIYFYAKAELWKVPLLRSIMNNFAIPVKRGTGDLGSIHKAAETIKCGKALGIFPQGTRMRKVKPSDCKPKGGIGMIAYQSKCDIIPAYIHTKKYKLALFRKVTITYGEPIPFSELGLEEGNITTYNKAADLIWKKICELAPEEDK